jgi:hypothetical protein
VDEPRGSLPDADFFIRLFVLTLEDGGLGRCLGQGYRAAVDTLDLPFFSESFQVTPGGGFADRKISADISNADPLAVQNILMNLILSFEAGNGIFHLNRSISIIFNHKQSHYCAIDGGFQVTNVIAFCVRQC